ncbi:amidohydrolase, partial [Streptomyces platensis subsp. clarensis]|nr:amidohydrolase [Streptomyces platensis subsp. clarensis]
MSTADLVFTGGPVFTGDPARTRATSLAVVGERIIAVGHDEVRALIGPKTEVVDLAGKLLIPGFQDAHIHAVSGGMEMAECDLTGTTGVDDYLRIIGEFAAAHPDRPWITGGGWSMESFEGGLPSRRLLDGIVPDRPVLLVNRDHHGAWANSRALELAGITADTPDPADGRIEREADGTPSGVLQEGAVALVQRLLPPSTAADRLAGLLRAQALLHSLGITGWQDALLGSFSGMADPADAYLAAAHDGTLTARVSGALWWDRARGAEQIPDLVERRASSCHGRFRAGSVKIMQDGVAENFTAAMTSPYLDACGCATANTGLSFVDPEALRGYVTELDALDFQVHFHALGDRAVREALNAVEAAVEANGRRG